MVIPVGYKDAIADTFYDKTFILYPVTTDDEEGDVVEEIASEGEEFSGNISFSVDDQIQLQYGTSTKVVATITTDKVVPLGSVVEYESIKYLVSEALTFDTHKLLILNTWLSKLETLTSA